MKKRIIIYSALLMSVFLVTGFMHTSKQQEIEDELYAEYTESRPQTQPFPSNLEKIKNKKINIQNYVYPTYIPQTLEYASDSLSINEYSKYFTPFKDKKVIDFDMQDTIYQNIITYNNKDIDKTKTSIASLLIGQTYADSKDIYKDHFKDNSTKKVTLENFTKEFEENLKQPNEIKVKIIETKELDIEGTIFDKAVYYHYDSVGFEEVKVVILFKTIDTIDGYDTIMVHISNSKHGDLPELLSLDELNKIIKGLKI